MNPSIEEAISSGQFTIESGEAIIMALKQLVDSEGWAIYRSIVEKQQVVRFDGIILNPLAGIDAAFGQEYMKGEIAGMRTALSMPQAMYETLTEQVRDLRQQRAAEAEGDQQ